MLVPILLALLGCHGGSTNDTGATDTGDTSTTDTSDTGTTDTSDTGTSDVWGAPESVGLYDLFEITFGYPTGALANPWTDAELRVTFTAPSGRTITVGGFYAAPDTFLARLAPDELGAWTFSSTMTSGGTTDTESGSFTVTTSDLHGFLRIDTGDADRLRFDDGTAYVGLGIGDCFSDFDQDGDYLDQMGFDGEARSDCPQGDTACPEIGWVTDLDTYLDAYGAAGFDLFRISPDNCSFGLFDTLSPDGNVYLEDEGQQMDRLVAALRSRGFRIYFGILGYNVPFNEGEPTAAQLEALGKYAAYCADRWGAEVDFWELMNETYTTQTWVTGVADSLRAADPYAHPVSISWQRPDDPEIDVVSPHWYQTEAVNEADTLAVSQFEDFRTPGKPIIYGEQGNGDVNWSADSALRMRIRIWTSMMEQGVLIFWNSSFAKDYESGAANIYLGPEERGYVRVMMDFAERVPSDAERSTLTASDPVRAYALTGGSTALVYAVDGDAVASPRTGATIAIPVPFAGTFTWIAPADGTVLGTEAIPSAGTHTLTVPTFTRDVAGYFTP